MKKVLLGALISICVLGLTGCHEHDFLPATCDMPSTCAECGETEGEPLGHDYSEADCDYPATCSRCGATKGNALGHDWLEATCTEPKTCSRCGAQIGTPKGHLTLFEDCEEAKACAICGEVIQGPGHTWVEGTCTEPTYCSECGAMLGGPDGHDWVNGVCSVCGERGDTLESLQNVCGLTATCEEDLQKCIVLVETDHNPYDVEYDYGEDYDRVVSMCDWSLVFDPEYYKKTFPMLAMLYHNDDELLLEHFQTVGVHEGRQGSADFNLGAYLHNCDRAIYDAFETRYEGYYFYYMLHYDEEKEVDTKTAQDGAKTYIQYKMVLTCDQKMEYQMINKFREEAGVPKVKFDSELAAIANYRAWINVEDDWTGHGWAIANDDKMHNIMDRLSLDGFAENTVTTHISSLKYYRVDVNGRKYFDSPEHREAMLAEKYHYTGTSNSYLGKNDRKNNNNDCDYLMSQFDVFSKNLSSGIRRNKETKK